MLKVCSVLFRRRLLVLLLIFIGLIAGADGFAQEFVPYSSGFVLKGNEVGYTDVHAREQYDPTSGENIIVYDRIVPQPKTMNDKEIQHASVNEQGMFPETIATAINQFSLYIIENLKELLTKLEDGTYFYSPEYPIVNETGQLAYYEVRGIWKTAVPFPGASMEQIFATQRIEPGLKAAIDKKSAELASHCPDFKVLYVNGKAMPYNLGGFQVRVKNHQLVSE